MFNQFVISLGTAQDGGYPHIGCLESCCIEAQKKISLKRLIASIAIVDSKKKKFWIIDISPNINEQLIILNKYIKDYSLKSFGGIFLTHAHIGHYAGLLNLGLEALNLSEIPVYVFPRMRMFIKKNAMFQQLIDNKNIVLKDMNQLVDIELNRDIAIESFLVPHRNELSETAGYRIKSKDKTLIYIPDIDSWEDWNIKLEKLVGDNDILILDGTFYNKKEIKHRDITKIPHPAIEDTMRILKDIDCKEKSKIYFTHLNHTNKVLDTKSKEYNTVITSGYNILKDKKVFNL